MAQDDERLASMVVEADCAAGGCLYIEIWDRLQEEGSNALV